MSTVDGPTAFNVRLLGPDGPCRLAYAPNGLGGLLMGEIAGVRVGWPVEVVEDHGDGGFSYCGLTAGSAALWADVYWFVLTTHGGAATLQYWGDRIMVREDRGAVG